MLPKSSKSSINKKMMIVLVCVERFRCIKGKTHSTSIIQSTKEFNQEQCSKRCCLRKDCVGFVYDSKTTYCYLTNKWGPPLTDNADRQACEKNPGM